MEALKRGAFPVVMVEAVKTRARAIEHTIAKEAPNVIVLSLELRRATEWLIKRGFCFDVIFADPPYHQGWGSTLLHVKALTKILKTEGVLVVEHASREPLHIVLPWTVTDVRSYGETTLTFLTHGEPEKGEPAGREEAFS